MIEKRNETRGEERGAEKLETNKGIHLSSPSSRAVCPVVGYKWKNFRNTFCLRRG
jgi:hypothetical protein